MKISLFFLICLFITACNPEDSKTNTCTDANCTSTTLTSPSVSDPVDTSNDDVTDPSPITDADTALPNEALTFDENVIFINTDAEQKAKFQKALEIIKKVVATEEFRNQVLNFTYNGAKTFVDNGGKTNAQIYQSILDGAESLQPAKNNTMNMEVELYTNMFTNTVGYTNTGTVRIWVNTKYFNNYTPASVASNLFHEWLHKLGYKHAVSYSVNRDSSVPYAIGRIIGSLGRQFL